MSRVGRGHSTARTVLGAVAAAATLVAMAGCSSSASPSGSGDAGGDVTIEFAQWWEPELPDGQFRALMDQFESENPGIKVKLVSGPYASTKAAAVRGGRVRHHARRRRPRRAWVNDFAPRRA